MNVTFRKSLMAGAIAALISTPTWAGGGAYGEDPAAQQRSQQQSSQWGTGGAAASGQLQSMTPQELQGMQVIGANGEQLGEVEQVVQSRAESNIQLVVSTEGEMGFTEQKRVAVPLDEFQLSGDQLQLSATEQELQARPEFASEQFVALQPEDQPLSDFAAFEPIQGEGSGMQQQQQGRNPILPGTSPEGRIRPLEEHPGESIYD